MRLFILIFCVAFLSAGMRHPKNKQDTHTVTDEMRSILAKNGINGFDKENGDTDKDTWHSYIDSYAQLLGPYKGKSCSLLEIGSLYGGSALLWHDYLQQAQILLVDVVNRIAPRVWNKLDSNRCKLKVLDAYSPQTLEILSAEYPEGFDIIIEDGNHVLQCQLFVLEHYTSILKKNGILVIEDIQSERDLEAIKQAAPSHLSLEVIDLRSKKNRYDDILIVVRKI